MEEPWLTKTDEEDSIKGDWTTLAPHSSKLDSKDDILWKDFVNTSWDVYFGVESSGSICVHFFLGEWKIVMFDIKDYSKMW